VYFDGRLEHDVTFDLCDGLGWTLVDREDAAIPGTDVKSLLPGGAADIAQHIQSGDHILAVNGDDCGGDDMVSVAERIDNGMREAARSTEMCNSLAVVFGRSNKDDKEAETIRTRNRRTAAHHGEDAGASHDVIYVVVFVGKYGMVCKAAPWGTGVVVDTVLKGGAAEASNVVAVGDHIVEVAGVDTREASVEAVAELLSGEWHPGKDDYEVEEGNVARRETAAESRTHSSCDGSIDVFRGEDMTKLTGLLIGDGDGSGDDDDDDDDDDNDDDNNDDEYGGDDGDDNEVGVFDIDNFGTTKSWAMSGRRSLVGHFHGLVGTFSKDGGGDGGGEMAVAIDKAKAAAARMEAEAAEAAAKAVEAVAKKAKMARLLQRDPLRHRRKMVVRFAHPPKRPLMSLDAARRFAAAAHNEFIFYRDVASLLIEQQIRVPKPYHLVGPERHPVSIAVPVLNSWVFAANERVRTRAMAKLRAKAEKDAETKRMLEGSKESRMAMLKELTSKNECGDEFFLHADQRTLEEKEEDVRKDAVGMASGNAYNPVLDPEGLIGKTIEVLEELESEEEEEEEEEEEKRIDEEDEEEEEGRKECMEKEGEGREGGDEGGEGGDGKAGEESRRGAITRGMAAGTVTAATHDMAGTTNGARETKGDEAAADMGVVWERGEVVQFSAARNEYKVQFADGRFWMNLQSLRAGEGGGTTKAAEFLAGMSRAGDGRGNHIIPEQHRVTYRFPFQFPRGNERAALLRQVRYVMMIEAVEHLPRQSELDVVHAQSALDWSARLHATFWGSCTALTVARASRMWVPGGIWVLRYWDQRRCLRRTRFKRAWARFRRMFAGSYVVEPDGRRYTAGRVLTMNGIAQIPMRLLRFKSRIDAWMAAEVGREGEDGGVRGGRRGGEREEREENDGGDKGEGGGGGSGGSGGSGKEPSSSPPPTYDDRMKSNASIRKERRGCGTIIHGHLYNIQCTNCSEVFTLRNEKLHTET
jgi:hypothetical protein